MGKMSEEQQLGQHSIAPFMDKIAKKEDLHDFTYTVKQDPKAGGYSGVLSRVTLNGKRNDGTNVSFDLVYKDQPKDSLRREQFGTCKSFANEATFYNVVLPAFEQLQDEKDICGGDSFSSLPRCFYAGEVVLLEDKSPLGFRLEDRQKPLNMDHCCLVMKEMGNLHALSFALRDQKPDEFTRINASVKEILVVTPVGGSKDYWDNSIKRAYAKYCEIASMDSKYTTSVLKRYCDNCFQMMEKAVNGEASEPYSVITHGDCWTNNYLFKSAEKSNTPETLCLLDFQQVRYCSPACDLMYFMSCCTSKETRALHFNDLLKEYHDSLSRFLRKLGSDPERLFPFSALEDQLERFGSFGMGMAILALPVVADHPDKVPDLDKLDTGTLAVWGETENPVVWRRFADFVEDMVEFGYLQ